MPVLPQIVQNPYGLPPLDGGAPDDEAAAWARDREELRQGLIQQAADRGGGRPGATLSAFSLGDVVPIEKWKAAPEPLPISKKDQVRTVLASRERQLKALEQFASDPKNPVAQDEVERIRGRIEDEAQRSLANSTLPSPVAMYEQLVDQEEPEVARARVKDNLLTVPGFKKEWSAFVSFDENNQPVYPKWMEKPMETAMANAMGVGDDKAAEEAKAAAADFAEAELKRSEPKPKDFEDGVEDPAYNAARIEWQRKMRQHLQHFHPDAAKLLPTFAEEQGFVAPSPAAAPTTGGQEIRSLSEAQAFLQSAESPEASVVVGPDGARYRFLPNGHLEMISGPTQ